MRAMWRPRSACSKAAAAKWPTRCRQRMQASAREPEVRAGGGAARPAGRPARSAGPPDRDHAARRRPGCRRAGRASRASTRSACCRCAAGRASATANHFPGGAVGEPADTLASFLLLHYGAVPPPPQVITGLALPDEAAVASALSTAAGRTVQRAARPARAWGALGGADPGQCCAGTAHAAHARRDAGGGPARIDGGAGAGSCPRAHRMLRHQPYGGRGHGGVLRGVRARRRAEADYRRYNIAGVAPGDDYAALHQALLRHGARIAAGESPRPDLLLIDGGAGQVQAARSRAARGRLRGPPAGRRVEGPGSAAGPGEAAPRRRAGGADAAGRQPRAAPHPARARRGASLCDHRPSPPARAPLPGVGARDRSRAGPGAPARAADALRRPAGRDARRRSRTSSACQELARRWRARFMITCIREPEA